MPSFTALQLVNRMARLLRQDPISSVATSPGDNYLDVLNDAIGNVLGEKDYPFDIRHDGELPTLASQSGSLLSLNNGGTVISIGSGDGMTADLFAGSLSASPSSTADEGRTGVITRIIPTSSTDFGDTAIRMTSATSIVGAVGIGIGHAFPGTTISSGTWQSLAAEYILPDLVRSVIEVRHEEEPLTLEKIPAAATFEQLVPRPHDTQQNPTWVGVGGYDVATQITPDDNTNNRTQPGLRLIIWPVPTSAILLQYSYRIRHIPMTADTDVLEGVSSEVVSQIVLAAAGLSQAFHDREPQTGFANESAAKARLDRMEHVNDPHSGRRHHVRSWDRRGSGSRRRFDTIDGGVDWYDPFDVGR